VSLRLGFHYHIPVYRDDQGQLRTPGYQGRFLDSLAARCATLICFAHQPRAGETEYMDYALQAPNIELVDVGPHSSVPARTLRAGSFTQPVRAWRARLDALLIRGPSPLLPQMAHAAGRLPTALLLVGDYVAGAEDLPQPRWRKEAIRLWARWNKHAQTQAAKRSLTFVNSRKLYDELHPQVPYLIETRTTTLTAADFFERADTCQQRPVRLLYTGRMDRAKGLLHMIEALALLVQQGEDVVLDLVGWPQKGDNILDELFRRGRALGIGERIFYHGFKPVGPELFEFYKQADIYVIASTVSEGFPRTIWEAMAHSLPVVATRVGSIPLFLESAEAAVFTPPNEPPALAEAVSRLLRSSELRHCLIQNAFRLAHENTLEARAAEIAQHITAWSQQ